MENMNFNLTNATSLELAEAAVKVLLKMKGIAVKLFCVKESSSITDYYITVTGRSKTHVASLADEVVYQLEEGGRNANRVEWKSHYQSPYGNCRRCGSRCCTKLWCKAL